MQNDTYLIWIDLEMTGCDSYTDHIIEVASIVTTSELEILSEGPVLAIHHEDEILASMDDWNVSHHTQSGLVERVRQSTIGYQEAERLTLDNLRQWVPEGKSPMCGNSICHDRRFLGRFMPDLEAYFHYRNIDVSTLKELAHRWAPELAEGVKKRHEHLALADIKESIEELRYYRNCFISCKP